MKLLSMIHDEIFQMDDTEWIDRYLQKSQRVLELGCGPGRILGHLSRRGISETVGLEIDRSMFEAVKSSFAGSENVQILQQDFTKPWMIDGDFNLILCMANTLTMLTNDEEWKAVFAQVRQRLRTDGKFLFWVRSSVGTNATKFTRKVNVEGVDYDFSYGFDEDFELRIRTYHLNVSRGSEIEKNVVRTRIISADEIRDLVDETGLRVEGLYQDVQESPYNHDSNWMYFVVGK